MVGSRSVSFLAIALLLIVPVSALARSQSADCSQTTPGTETVSGPDGAHCVADSNGGTATATAAGTDSSATSTVDATGSADSDAKSGGDASAEADASGTAKATAKSKGTADASANNADATAEATSQGDATADATDLGNAKAIASSGGAAEADATSGTAKATATHKGAARADSLINNCIATAKAVHGAAVEATCATVGGFVHAEATNGGVADGFDFKAPVCTKGNHGTAKVRSTGGNCG